MLLHLWLLSFVRCPQAEYASGRTFDLFVLLHPRVVPWRKTQSAGSEKYLEALVVASLVLEYKQTKSSRKGRRQVKERPIATTMANLLLS